MSNSHAAPQMHRLVGVTFGELAAWHANGETRLLRGRLVDAPEASDAPGQPARGGYAARRLLRRLPPLRADDEEGVLVVWLGPGPLSDDAEDSQLVRIPMDRVSGVVPLTARARQILRGRLEPYGLEPEEPWFEEVFRVLSCERRVEASARAGSDLLRAFGANVQELPTDSLRDSAALALALKDFDGVRPGSSEPAQ